MYRMHFSDLYPLVVLRYNNVFNSTEYFIYLSLLRLRKHPKIQRGKSGRESTFLLLNTLWPRVSVEAQLLSHHDQHV